MIRRSTLLFGILILVSITLLSAQMQSLGSFAQGSCVTLQQTCNCTSVNVTTITYPNSSFALSGTYPMPKSGQTFYYSFCNTSSMGHYIYTTCGNDNGQTSCPSVDFYISTNGEQQSTTSAIFYSGLLFVLIFFMGICVFSFVRFDNLLNRVGMIGLGYLLLIAISFVGWNMARGMLSTDSFISQFMFIVFEVLMFGALPLLIGGFAWYMLMILRIKEINRLMEKGFSLEEAEHRVKRRRK